MSGIFGIVNRDGQPVTAQTVQSMRDAMAYWGPDGGGTWVEGRAGLGQLLLYNTPEALNEKPPHYWPEYRLAFAAEARIDNRDELCDRFRIPQVDRPRTPDTDLILKAYLLWGEACADHLLGDWSFAVWHPDARRLFLARDHHGNTALYTYIDDRVFAFASCKKALLALPQVPRTLNELRIAQILTSWPGDGVQTVHEAIERLPPAHTLTVTAEKVTKQRYWYLENTPMLTLGSDDAYVEGFLEVFTEAARCRLRSYRPVGSMLSGGLDSGSVTALAARELRREGKRLPAFTSVPLYDVSEAVGRNRFGDEGPLATATASFAGNVDITTIRAESVNPIDGIRRSLWVHDAPGHAAGNQYWITDLLQTAQSQGLGTLLTGQGGNATISWTGMRRTPEWRQIRQMRSVTEKAKAIAKKLAGPQYAATRDGYHRYRLRRGAQPWRDYSAIHPEFARRLDLGRRMIQAGHDPWFKTQRPTPQDHRYAVIGPGRDQVGARWAESGAAYGLEIRDPTTDRRLMAYCLSVPDTQYSTTIGADRALIRHAMRGRLPDEVRLNQTRGHQSADIAERLRSLNRCVLGLLDRMAENNLSTRCLDLDRMRQVRCAANGSTTPQPTDQFTSVLLRGVMVGVFLMEEVPIG